jgi:hypothetical protein
VRAEQRGGPEEILRQPRLLAHFTTSSQVLPPDVDSADDSDDPEVVKKNKEKSITKRKESILNSDHY